MMASINRNKTFKSERGIAFKVGGSWPPAAAPAHTRRLTEMDATSAGGRQNVQLFAVVFSNVTYLT
jgi:hypothetical protein